MKSFARCIEETMEPFPHPCKQLPFVENHTLEEFDKDPFGLKQ
jgi:hypothetical protein